MRNINKFIFETSFDEDKDATLLAKKKAAEEARLAAEQRQREADLAGAREAGFAEGQQAGLKEAAQQNEAILAATLARINDQMARIAESQESFFESLRQQACEFSLTIARKVLPEMSRRHALGEIEGLIRACLDRLLSEPRIMVRVNQGILKDLEGHLGDIAARTGYNGKIILAANNRLEDTDCHVEWTNGGADRDLGAIWREIDGVIGNFLSGEPTAEDSTPDPVANTASEESSINHKPEGD